MAKVSPLILLPPVIFAAIAGLFLSGLFRDNPDVLPSAQEGFSAPDITEIAVEGLPTFQHATLQGNGVKVLNFFASWCAPCRLEHAYLMDLAESVPLYGVNRDRTDAQARAFLKELGNPFSGIVADPKNRQSIEWGVYALPETFVIDANGQVVLHLRGPINEPIYHSRILPAIEAASAE